MYLNSFLLSIFLFIAPIGQAKDPYAHTALVNYYQTAAKDEDIAEEFHELMQKYKGKNPVTVGYKAVSNAIMAKHVWSPYSKIKYLRASASIFDEAVQLNPNNAEVRFLRFSIENYIPRYLNMSSNLEEDKKVFMAALLKHPKSGIPNESVKIMKDFLLRKDLVTGEERRQVENLKL
ncbi:hypothetical protein [Rufibacter roseus]|uniref:Tetratricopeptide repeat protein n=1 Tax=Rufibacter roseus TaxID=1567108 RepID=A0ABW2DS86_9BACT|nr:hypothetical protein [Rufibacter roseus]